MFTLLVIDDEASIRFSIEQVFEGHDARVLTAETAEEGLRIAAEELPDVILLDILLGSQSGLDMFHKLRQIDSKALVIFITGHGTAETAIEAMKLGAHDYLIKPLDIDQLQRVVGQAMQISRMMRVPTVLEKSAQTTELPQRLIGAGPAMQAIFKEVGRVAAQDVNVLILGESGTGKELICRAIYQHSARSAAPFLAINCAAIPESLLESELFGHERGAFSGADHRRIGKFEQCHNGTLLLDEVGDMSPNTQAKILRLIEAGQFERIGGNETVTADVRILAATNQNLEALIEKDRFRKDLYYRLRGVTIHLPPLRERVEDIPELAHYFLFRFSHDLGTMVQSIHPTTMERLLAYPWPGNVRELQSVIREAMLRSSGTVLLPEFLPPELARDSTAEEVKAATTSSMEDSDWHALPHLLQVWLDQGETDLYRRALEHFDRMIVSNVLQHAEGNQARASAMLGLSRVTLRSKLRARGLSVEKQVATRAPIETQAVGAS
jgi:two-component system nitrogen regulation response regulator GlnG